MPKISNGSFLDVGSVFFIILNLTENKAYKLRAGWDDVGSLRGNGGRTRKNKRQPDKIRPAAFS